MEEKTQNSRPDPIQAFLVQNFERVFLVVLVAAVPLVVLLSHQKLALLNFYFLPVLLAAYFLNLRAAVLGGALSVLVVLFLMIVRPEAFVFPQTRLGLYLHLGGWGGILILAGAMVGRLHEKMGQRVARVMAEAEEVKRGHEALQLQVKTANVKMGDLEGLRKKLETALYSAMDPWVANMLVHRRLVNEKRELTVLFADVVQFTTAVEDMQPEDVVRHLNRLFQEIEPIIGAFHGHLDKFIGDGLMAEFGIPRQRQQNALQAVLAAVQIQKRVGQPDFSWKLRLGISHGEALVGLVGSQHRQSYTALGDVVNVAARLQKICPPGSVCVDEATHEKIAYWFNARRIVRQDRDSVEELASKLRGVQERLSKSPSDCDAFLEAAELSGEMGEVPQAVEYYRRALSLNPQMAERVEARVAELVLRQDRPDKVRLRGMHKRIYSYEILSLKDPLADSRRIPASVKALGDDRLHRYGVNRDALLGVEALDATVGHSLVTAAVAGAVAEGMGLSEETQRTAFEAGFYHDVGRQNVPEFILNQEEELGALPEQDLGMIRVHVEAARVVLASLGVGLRDAVLEAIDSHHEAFNGLGYPKGLAGEAIPLPGRLVRVADEYDGLTSGRRRRSLEPAAALIELKAQAERGLLDPKAVAALTSLLRHGLGLA